MAQKRLEQDLNFIQQAPLELQIFDGDLNIIQKLDDEPNDVGGLTSAELKAEFDKAGNTIKTYINETLIPAILSEDATEKGRQAAETARVAAEKSRVEVEKTREAAEAARVEAENGRAAAEKDRQVWEYYNEQRTYVPGNKVFYQGSSFVCTTPAQGILPTEKTHWTVIVEKGDSGDGSGDMLSAVYDSTHQRRDIFQALRQQAEETQTALSGKQDNLTGQDGQILGFDASGKPIPRFPKETFSRLETLTGETAKQYGLEQSAVPDAVFQKIAASLEKIDGEKILTKVGTYTGTGQSDFTLNLGFYYDLIFIFGVNGGQVGALIAYNGIKEDDSQSQNSGFIMAENNFGYAGNVPIIHNMNTREPRYNVTLKNTTTPRLYKTYGTNGLNENNLKYAYFAIGTMKPRE